MCLGGTPCIFPRKKLSSPYPPPCEAGAPTPRLPFSPHNSTSRSAPSGGPKDQWEERKWPQREVQCGGYNVLGLQSNQPLEATFHHGTCSACRASAAKSPPSHPCGVGWERGIGKWTQTPGIQGGKRTVFGSGTQVPSADNPKSLKCMDLPNCAFEEVCVFLFVF